MSEVPKRLILLSFLLSFMLLLARGALLLCVWFPLTLCCSYHLRRCETSQRPNKMKLPPSGDGLPLLLWGTQASYQPGTILNQIFGSTQCGAVYLGFSVPMVTASQGWVSFFSFSCSALSWAKQVFLWLSEADGERDCLWCSPLGSTLIWGSPIIFSTLGGALGSGFHPSHPGNPLKPQLSFIDQVGRWPWNKSSFQCLAYFSVFALILGFGLVMPYYFWFINVFNEDETYFIQYFQ